MTPTDPGWVLRSFCVDFGVIRGDWGTFEAILSHFGGFSDLAGPPFAATFGLPQTSPQTGVLPNPKNHQNDAKFIQNHPKSFKIT